MENLNFVSQENKPLMAFFLQPFPASIYTADEESVFNPILNMNETLQGIPLFIAAARTSKPPTSCSTPGHTIKSGYTPSGKWKPAKFVPGKTDKRAGK
jgi:hypothetical protein